MSVVANSCVCLFYYTFTNCKNVCLTSIALNLCSLPNPKKSKNMHGFGPWGAKSMHAY